jgi:hypothetical protein
MGVDGRPGQRGSHQLERVIEAIKDQHPGASLPPLLEMINFSVDEFDNGAG